MEEQVKAEQLQPIEQTKADTSAKNKRNKRKVKTLRLEDLKKGDILKTREYVVQLNYAEVGENGSYRLHCDWGHCTADFSKDRFTNDWVECLPEYIIKLWSSSNKEE